MIAENFNELGSMASGIEIGDGVTKTLQDALSPLDAWVGTTKELEKDFFNVLDSFMKTT